MIHNNTNANSEIETVLFGAIIEDPEITTSIPARNNTHKVCTRTQLSYTMKVFHYLLKQGVMNLKNLDKMDKLYW